jgi:hypothetical protein
MSINITILYNVTHGSLVVIYQTTWRQIPEDINILVLNITIMKNNLIDILILLGNICVCRKEAYVTSDMI